MEQRKVIKSFKDKLQDGKRVHVGDHYEADQERLDHLSALGFLESVESDDDKKPDGDDEPTDDNPDGKPDAEDEKPKRGRKKKETGEE